MSDYNVKTGLLLHEVLEFMETITPEQAISAKVVLEYYDAFHARGKYNVIYPIK